MEAQSGEIGEIVRNWSLGRKLSRLAAAPAVFSHLRFSPAINYSRQAIAEAVAALAAWETAFTSSETPGPIAVETDNDLQ